MTPAFSHVEGVREDEPRRMFLLQEVELRGVFKIREGTVIGRAPPREESEDTRIKIGSYYAWAGSIGKLPDF